MPTNKDWDMFNTDKLISLLEIKADIKVESKVLEKEIAKVILKMDKQLVAEIMEKFSPNVQNNLKAGNTPNMKIYKPQEVSE